MDDRMYPITNYNGRHIPFPDQTFDIVFSSHVLEHVGDLEQTHADIKRVLKPGGSCVHVMPTAAWQFWTMKSNFPTALRSLLGARTARQVEYP